MALDLTRPRRIALVSKDISKPCFGAVLGQIAELADKHQAEALIFSLFSFWDDRSSTQPSQRILFSRKKFLTWCLFERGSWNEDNNYRVERWEKGKNPVSFIREFARSASPPAKKIALIEKMPTDRLFGNGYAFLYCGEAGICKISHATRKINDEYGFLPLLKKLKVRVLIDSSHTVFRRWEFKYKYQAFSSQNRTYIGLWNEKKGYRTNFPWLCYKNGKECTEEITEIENPIPSRKDIRIGILEI